MSEKVQVGQVLKRANSDDEWPYGIVRGIVYTSVRVDLFKEEPLPNQTSVTYSCCDLVNFEVYWRVLPPPRERIVTADFDE